MHAAPSFVASAVDMHIEKANPIRQTVQQRCVGQSALLAHMCQSPVVALVASHWNVSVVQPPSVHIVPPMDGKAHVPGAGKLFPQQ